MDYVVEKMQSIKLIGFERNISFESAYEDTPKFWNDVFSTYINPLFNGKKPETDIEKIITESCVGEYGVSICDNAKNGTFRYIIAGTYHGGEVPEGMVIYEFPAAEWAKFSCKGPMPGALQSVNSKIFREWLPGNTEYELSIDANIEWYSGEGNTTDPDYESAIWIPVKRK